MNRVQQAPAVSKAIHGILWRCQQKIGSWVGSAVRAPNISFFNSISKKIKFFQTQF